MNIPDEVWVPIAPSLRLILNPTNSVWSFKTERWDGSLSAEIWKQIDVLADLFGAAKGITERWQNDREEDGR